MSPRDALAHYYHACGRLGIDLATARDLARFAPAHSRYCAASNCNGTWQDGEPFASGSPRASRVRSTRKTLANRIVIGSACRAELVVSDDPRGPTLYLRDRIDSAASPIPVPGS